MPQRNRAAGWILGCAVTAMAGAAGAQDWPQFRGPNRDAKAAGFTAPATWPKSFSQKWKRAVGDGVATPSLVGDKLYVFARDNNNEVTRCLDVATGKELWQDKYPAAGVSGPAGNYAGPRSSPTVADGKVVTLGVHGTLSCLDAATGKLLWRKDDFRGSEPKFAVSSSPLVVDGVCIAQLGGQGNGGIVAYQLATGELKWKWTADSPANASPVVMTIGEDKLVFAETDANVVAVRAADGKEVWRTPFGGQGPGVYNAATPVVEGQTLIYSGGNRGTHAVKFEKAGGKITGKELWASEKGVQFASPVVKDGLYYGLSGQNELFCLNAETGKLAWSTSLGGGGGGRGGPGGGRPGGGFGPGGGGQPGGGAPGGGQPGGGRRGGMRGGGGGMGGYGSIVDAGSVLLALTPAMELIAFAPGDKQYTEQAKIKVADTPTYAYPVLSGNRALVKDQMSVTLWTLD